MTFICNAGPVIALAKIDQLSLLSSLADSIRIPATVFHETLAKPGVDADRIIEATQSFLTVIETQKEIDPGVMFATRHLDAGEKQVIAVAASTSKPFTVVLDDAAGRRVAGKLGYPLLGFIGILLIAKKRSLVAHVVPLLLEAKHQGYWLSEELIESAASIANESTDHL